MKETIQELADTTATQARGSSITKYALEPSVWLREISEAAKNRHFFKQVCKETKVQKGNKDVVIPYKTVYLRTAGTMLDQSTDGSAVSFTTMDNHDGLQLSPSQHAYGVAVTDYALRVNAIDLLSAAKEELIYYAGDVVDAAVAAALRDAGTATSSERGAQELYGGDATSTSTIESGDILTTDLIADSKQRLSSINCKYWSGGSESTSSASKNPWMPTPDEPFVLFVAPEQENDLLKNSQFVNAAEYGSGEVVLNGEVGKYLGVKVVVTNNTPASGDGGFATSNDWGSGTNIKGHMCLIVKAKKCSAFAWGREMDLKVFPYPRELEMDLILVMDYATDSLHDDAIVKIYVSDA